MHVWKLKGCGKSLYLILGLALWLVGGRAALANPDGVAVIIGNANYGNDIPAVTYAHRDAAAIKKYVRDVLGFEKENIIHLRDTSKADLEAVFGNHRSHKGKLWRYADPSGRSDIVIFYSGHGVPGLNDKRGYLLPTNAQPDTAEINGYSIDTLYRNIAKIKAKSRTVLLDACFSGESPRGMLIKGASAVFVSAKSVPKKIRKKSKLTIITAADAGQLASWDENAKHGLFTRHFLDGAYGKADKNRDGRVSLGEIQKYLDRHMTRAARREYGRDQQVSVRGNKNIVLARTSKNPEWRKVLTSVPEVKKEPVTKTLAAVQPPAVKTPDRAKLPANLDGVWKDENGNNSLTLSIKGEEVEVLLVMGDVFLEMITTIKPDGKIKKTYNNFSRGTAIVTGSLQKIDIEFTGYYASRDWVAVLKKVE